MQYWKENITAIAYDSVFATFFLFLFLARFRHNISDISLSIATHHSAVL